MSSPSTPLIKSRKARCCKGGRQITLAPTIIDSAPSRGHHGRASPTGVLILLTGGDPVSFLYFWKTAEILARTCPARSPHLSPREFEKAIQPSRRIRM